ncbi:peptidylprolyl isomerase [Peptococcaceae bacterium 1198_IL3148]
MPKKIFAALMGLLLLMAVVAGCGQRDVAATVNGEEISLEKYNKRVADVKKNFEQQGIDLSSEQGKEMEQTIKARVLDSMIEEVLILQQAEEKGVMPENKEIDDQLQQIKDTYQTDEEYQKALKELNTTEEELREVITINLAGNNLYQKVTADVKEINIEQAREYYQQNKEQFSEPEQLNVRHILFFVNEGDNPSIPVKRSGADAKKLAEQVIADLNQGADFAELAKEKSEDTGSKGEGGTYIFAPEAGLTDPDFTKAAEALAVGQYTKEPVKSQFGYHVIKLEQQIPAKQSAFEEVKESIVLEQTQKAKDERFMEFINGVKEKAKIEKKVEVSQDDSAKK